MQNLRTGNFKRFFSCLLCFRNTILDALHYTIWKLPPPFYVALFWFETTNFKLISAKTMLFSKFWVWLYLCVPPQHFIPIITLTYFTLHAKKVLMNRKAWIFAGNQSSNESRQRKTLNIFCRIILFLLHILAVGMDKNPIFFKTRVSGLTRVLKWKTRVFRVNSFYLTTFKTHRCTILDIPFYAL